MSDRSFLSWPFFEERHRELSAKLEDWCEGTIHDAEPSDADYACRATVAELGKAGFLKLCVGEANRRPDVRSLALCRETFARHHGLVDFAFAMQGLGSGAISLFGTIEQKREWLPRVASGEAIAAFAMTEPECGSDAANMSTSAMRDGNEWVLVGEKTYISNGGIADFYVTFARTGEGEGARGLSAFIVPADAVEVAERIEVIAPHPIGRLKYDNVRVPADAIIGEPGEGFRIGMETLNLFRVTVGAAALGFARRALDEALAFTKERRLGTATLADNAVTQAKLADMALAVDASALLIYRAAWQQDEGGTDNRRAAAMAKLHATEAAQQVIDAAVQLHGGAGVTRGVKVEELYRDIRALRIYEGASEVQRQIIARDVLKGGDEMKILNPSNWPRPKGYSNGISVKGRMIFTAGVVGWDEHESFPEYTLHGQFARALRNTLQILAEDGAGPQHIVRMTCYVTDRHEYISSRDEIGAAWREIMGPNYPAMALVEVKGLVESAAKVEIETTAVVEDE